MMFLTEAEEQQCQTVELRFQPESTSLLAACKLEGGGGGGEWAVVGVAGGCLYLCGWVGVWANKDVDIGK